MGSIKGVRRSKYRTRKLKSSGETRCRKCNKTYKRPGTLKHHIQTRHSNYHVICPLCDKKYTSVSICNRHIRNVHKNPNYKAFDLKLQNGSITSDEEEEEEERILDKLSFEADEKFPCMANVLAIKENEKFGKHIVAECDIDVGNVVISTPAFATIECLKMGSESGCFECGGCISHFIKCPYCIDIKFCSKSCSKSKLHKSKCNQLFSSNDCRVIRMTTEIITVAFKSVKNVKVLLDLCRRLVFRNNEFKNCEPAMEPALSEYAEIIQFRGKEEDHNMKIAKRVYKLVVRSLHFKQVKLEDYERLIVTLARLHAASIKSYWFSENFPVSEFGVIECYFIYSFLCRINHSCAPNLHHYIDDNHITHCVTIRPIKRGEQVFINYVIGMELENKQERQFHIKDSWYFDCQCEKCCQDVKTGTEEDFIQQELKIQLKENNNHVQNLCLQYLRKVGHSWFTSVDFVVNRLIACISD